MTHLHGIFALIKPSGMTSHDLVNLVRKISGERRVGHAGTLDPLASGVLVVGIGREATKQLGKLSLTDKEYLARVRLGGVSETDDAEGEIRLKAVSEKPTLEQIEAVAKTWVGEVDQKPPAYSAISVAGIRAYTLARQGKRVNLGTRRVTIEQIEVTEYVWPDLDLKVKCGSGTYIRSLARDMGEALGTGGYLTALVRTRVGDYPLAKALTLEQLRMQEAN